MFFLSFYTLDPIITDILHVTKMHIKFHACGFINKFCGTHLDIQHKQPLYISYTTPLTMFLTYNLQNPIIQTNPGFKIPEHFSHL